MDEVKASAVLGALARPARLKIVSTLAESGPGGLASGELARRLSIPQNAMSTYLTTLTSVGLIERERRGRYVFSKADLETIQQLIVFIFTECYGENAQRLSDVICRLTAMSDHPSTG